MWTSLKLSSELWRIWQDGEALIEAFASGRDIHKENSERFFGSYSEDKRLAVKRTVYGSIYGEGVDRIVAVAAAENPPIRLVRHEVAVAQEGFFMLYPEIKEVWWSDVKRDLKYRLLTTPLAGSGSSSAGGIPSSS